MLTFLTKFLSLLNLDLNSFISKNKNFNKYKINIINKLFDNKFLNLFNFKCYFQSHYKKTF